MKNEYLKMLALFSMKFLQINFTQTYLCSFKTPTKHTNENVDFNKTKFEKTIIIENF